MKRALILGAGGFIGSWMAKRLKAEGFFVIGADLKYPEFARSYCDNFYKVDLRDAFNLRMVLDGEIDELYQFAADMGGAGFVFTGEHDAEILHNNALINLNVVKAATEAKVKRVFYASSACIYPQENQEDEMSPDCSEDSAYPAHPDSDYGWEKLFSERLYAAWYKNCGLDVRIARYHNIFGPEGTWTGGREKAPAAICRKVAEVVTGGEIEIWGDGEQTRSFLFIDDCIDATRLLMNSDYREPINIGSEEMISINGLAEMVSVLAGKDLYFRHIAGPEGVRGRNSDNCVIGEVLKWAPQVSLREGMKRTFKWIAEQVDRLSRVG